MTAIINIGIDPVLVRLGPLSVHWYGLMYVVGISAGLFVTLPYAERLGIGRDTYYAIFWPVVIGCLIGGRLYYVVQSDFGWYLRHPSQILATWEGGMAFYGAVFAGVIVVVVTSALRHVSPARVLDVAALFIPISQAFGRIGNLVNGDIIGYSSTLAWATRYTNPSNTFVPSHRIAYQPAAAYELLFSLALFSLIWALRFRFRLPGTLFMVWLVLYSAGQFVLFFARDNAVVVDGLKQAQVTSVVILLIALPAWLWWRRRAGSEYDPGSQDLRDAPSAA
jgi:phosphatidylglycerol---prolipoprotein diacylglyceryl transferase